MTTPQSEIQSGALAVRLRKSITQACDLEFEEIVHISDSECTIAMINKESVALNEFMGNRVVEITSVSKPSEWYHVKSEHNIVDLGTRANATLRDIEPNSPWQRGDFLRLSRELWPTTQDIGPEHIPKEALLKSKLRAVIKKAKPLIDISEWRMRTYTLLMQSTARVISAIENKSFRDSTVTTSALEKAEKYWISQSMVFTSEAYEKGHLKSLRPQIDEKGVIHSVIELENA